jgi:hypothetical protein
LLGFNIAEWYQTAALLYDKDYAFGSIGFSVCTSLPELRRDVRALSSVL